MHKKTVADRPIPCLFFSWTTKDTCSAQLPFFTSRCIYSRQLASEIGFPFQFFSSSMLPSRPQRLRSGRSAAATIGFQVLKLWSVDHKGQLNLLQCCPQKSSLNIQAHYSVCCKLSRIQKQGLLWLWQSTRWHCHEIFTPNIPLIILLGKPSWTPQ